jgi:hypothetical protein
MTAPRAVRLAAVALACVCAVASAAVTAAPLPHGDGSGVPANGSGTLADAARPAADGGRAPSRSPGKPTAPFAIDYVLSAEPAVGALLEIALEVGAPDEVADLGVDAQAADNQALLVAALAPAADRPGRWTVTVMPLADGTSYLSVTVRGTIGGSVQTRSVVIPVRIGGNAKAAAQAVEAAPETGESAGEQVVLLPVVETPRRARE